MVAARSDVERIRRTISEIASAINAREELFSRLGVALGCRPAPGSRIRRVPPEVPRDIFLVVDGWGSFREEHDRLETVIGELAGRGLTYGVHVILSVNQTMQVRLRMQSAFGGRIELRLNDAFESSFDRKAQERIVKDRPGRGLMEGGLESTPRYRGSMGWRPPAISRQRNAIWWTRRPGAGPRLGSRAPAGASTSRNGGRH